MKKYTLSFADSISHKPEHPDRTAMRSLQWDVLYNVWPARAAMARTIRMQQKREHKASDWRACVKLQDHEGY